MPAGPAPASSRALSRALSWLRDVVWLAGPRKRVRERPRHKHAGIREWWLAAEARLRVARQLDPETEFTPAVALYREGIAALAGAALVSVEGSAAPAAVADMRAAWASLERVWPELGTGADIREFVGAGRALCETAPLDRGPLDPAEAAAVGGAMGRLAELVERAVEPRTQRRLALLAAVRIAALALAVGALVMLGVVLPVRQARAPKNLALGRPVTLSSVTASRKDVGGAYLVNGKLEWSYGAHTDNSKGVKDPSMTIDLGAPKRIGRIVVYNRGDQNFDDCLPLTLSVGDDPSAPNILGERTTHFSRNEPWVVDHINVTARYVRVSKPGESYIALDEIEVYAP